MVFANPGTSFVEAGRIAVQVLSKPVNCQGTEYLLGTHAQCRGTSLIGAGKLSRYRMFVRGTGAVSRYKLSRSQKTVKVQDLYCGQVRVSGCKSYYKFILSAGAKAKSVTSNLPILSVLCGVFLLDLIFYH